jgi:hypothetical protein
MSSNTLFSIVVDINAPPGHVWEIMSDVENWHLWTSSVRRVRRLDKGPLAVGSKMWIYQPKLPPALWRVKALDDSYGFTGITSGLGVSVTAHHFIQPAPGGSSVTLSIEFGGLFGLLAARLTSKLNNRYLQLEAAGLKKKSEASYVSSHQG